MNIFATSSNFREAASVLDNKRVNKMIIESVQMMCTALQIHGCDNVPYKMTHKNHPCTRWVAESYKNFSWLYHYTMFLNAEYKKRYNKDVDHKSAKICNDYKLLLRAVEFLPNKELTPFVNCTANHKHIENVHEAYRQCLVEKWKNDKIEPKWSNVTKPSFYMS